MVLRTRAIRALAVSLVLAFAVVQTSAFAQTYYAALPNAQVQFFDSDGNPLAGGKLYTYQAGTTTAQDTFTDSTSAIANTNPVVLDSAGRGAVYLASTNPYKLVLKTSADVTVWTQDNVSDFGAILKRDLTTSFATKSLDTEKQASQYTGLNAGAQILAAIADIPSSGGKVSAIGLQGNQAITADPFVGVTKPVVLEWGAATYTISTNVTVPSNVTMVFDEGSTLSVNGGSTLTISGGVNAPLTQIFTGAGTVTFNSKKVDTIYPQWWGAKADNSNDDTSPINKALTAATSPANVTLVGGTYKITDSLVVPSRVALTGNGIGSEILSSSAASPAAEMVRLNGDYASIENVWLHGGGQVPSAVDGRRGIWIGSCSDHLLTCYTDHARVENVTIDNFKGNGISGDYRYAKIVNNTIFNTTDAGIFLQPPSVYNLIEGNTISGSKYSGIDCNGSDNRIVHNVIYSNGGGALDTYSQAGILVSYVAASAIQPNASRNIIENNTIYGNVGWGILIYNASPSATAATHSPYGNIVRGNVVTDHTNQYDENATVTLQSWGGGIVVMGADDTIVDANESSANTFNYIVVGTTNGASSVAPGTIMTNNKSLNAVANTALATFAGSPVGTCATATINLPSGIGFFFPSSARLDQCGGYTAQDVTLTGNSDRYSASDSYQWYKGNATGVSWTGWHIDGNKSDTAGAYGFNIANPGTFGNNFWGQNYAINATTADYNGFSTNNGYGLTANSATPSIANGKIWFTQNTVATAYTNFTGGVPGQSITIRVADANSRFNFNGTNLKGNFASDYLAVSGDSLKCDFDATNWQCTVNHPGPATVFANVNQGTDKTTTVPQNGVLSGRITMHTGAGPDTLNACCGAGSSVTFNLTNDKFTTGRDFVAVWQSGGPGNYVAIPKDNGANTISITVQSLNAAGRDDAVSLDYEIRKR